MLRVLRILNRLIIGGPAKNAIYLTKYMQPEFETMLVTGGHDVNEEGANFLATENGVEPYCIPEMQRNISFNNDWIAFQKLKKIIKEFKPDIVHTHAAKSGALGRMAAKQCRVPVIVHTFHGHVFHSYFDSLKTKAFITAERQLAKFSDAIVAISNIQEKELVDDFKIAPKSKFRVIPLGLDLDIFLTDQEIKRKKFRNEFQIDDETIAIGIVGRLVPVKNHSLFLKGLKNVLEKSNRKIKAFIVGDGETRKAIQEEACLMGIKYSIHTDNIHQHPLVFTSWRTDIDVIYAGLDIVALTSLNEGTPVSLIEAQTSGMPIVSTRVGGISDVVLENVSALLSDINNEEEFKNNLLKMVEDDQLRNSFKEAGRINVLNKFTYHLLVADMKELYFELLEKKSPAAK
jgi:glycosyltransferase involved in cell wall biosynthesis